MDPIETERLVIRRFAAADIERIYQLVYADQEVRQAWSGYTGTLEDFRTRFATNGNWQGENGFGYLAITLKPTGLLIGLMGFQRYQADEDTTFMQLEDPREAVGCHPAAVEAELTYALGRAYWGSGYATEAGHALLAYGFEQLAIDRIVNAVIDHPKHRSRKLMERLGFRIIRNLNPTYMTQGPFAGSPGVIGILEKSAWSTPNS